MHPSCTHLARFVAEIFDGEGDDRRRAVVGVCPPRELDTRVGHVEHVRPRRRSGERRRLGRPVEYDARVGRRFDDEVGVPRRLARLAGRLARVQARVGFAQACRHGIFWPCSPTKFMQSGKQNVLSKLQNCSAKRGKSSKFLSLVVKV